VELKSPCLCSSTAPYTANVTSGMKGGPSQALAALAERLWIVPGQGRVRITWDGEPSPAGHVLLEEYLVAPSIRSARFLVPVDDRTAGLRCVLGYNRLRPLATQLLRIGVAAAIICHAERLGLLGRMRVWACDDTLDKTSSPLLSDALRGVLGSPGAVFSVGVHGLDPNSKPTLQVFDRLGVRGFAKVGWTAPTARLVSNEAKALAHRPTPSQKLRRPGLLYSGRLCDLPVTIVEPMPIAVRRYRSDSPPPAPALADVAGELSLRQLTTTNYWRGVQNLIAARSPLDLRDGLRAYCHALEESAQAPLAFGRWHGDWVPWNLALDGSELYAFDWEHSAAEAPWGFDLAHWSFQQALLSRGLDARSAAAAADHETAAWPTSGVDVPQPGLVVSLYLLEMALRTIRLKSEGGSWNPRLHPALFDVLNDRLSNGVLAR
jgi:hypothetical protein